MLQVFPHFRGHQNICFMKLCITVLTAILVLAIIFSCNDSATSASDGNTGDISNDSMISRGKYLVMMGGCSDCHSPKKMGTHGPEADMDLYLSGHPSSVPLGKIDTTVLHDWVLFTMDETATVGPWGITYSANITPDSTGIGSWTKEQFFKAMREGKHKGLDNSRPIMPPMPWQNVGGMSDVDLSSLFAYLQSIKAVHNVVLEAQLAARP